MLFSLRSQPAGRRMLGLSLMLFASLCAALVQPLRAEQPDSLKFVPADAEFYASALRTREQLERLMKSKAVARLMQLPAVQMGLAQAKQQWDSNTQAGVVEQMMRQPENQQLLKMLQDAVSHEIFFYGGSGFGEIIAALNRMNGTINMVQLEALTSGQNPNEVMQKRLPQLLADMGKDLDIPSSVIGFKLSDPQAATAQLQRLEMLAGAMLGEQPDEIKNRFKRQKIAGGDFLTLNLDGSLVPWNQIPLDEVPEEQQAVVKALMDQLKEKTLTICLGVREDYLLLAFGESHAHVEALGNGAALRGRKELATVLKHADKPVTGVSYVSESFMRTMANAEQQLADLQRMAEQAIPLAPISDELKQELTRDMQSLMTKVKEKVPEQGAIAAIEFFTPQGFESYTYNWTGPGTLDALQPLSILNHVGGNPLAFFASRGKQDPEDLELLTQFVKRAVYYGEQIGLQQAEEDERELYQRLKQEFAPTVERVHEALQEMILPALQDGQGAFVLDAKSTSDSWHLMMPASDKKLPMLEIGLVLGVSDANLLKKGFGELFASAQFVADKLHELSTDELTDKLPQEIPAVKIPKPKSRQFPSGELFYYVLPEQSGLDKQIAPNAGLGEKTAVLSLMPRFTKRLLDETPLRSFGPLENSGRPLVTAAHLNFAELISALEPWVDYGMTMAMAANASTQQPDAAFIKEHVTVVMQVLKCFQGVATATYIENDVVVTHAAVHFKDIE